MNRPVILQTTDPFPFPYHSDADGLVAIGGGLSVRRLLAAYSIGLFPWFEEDGWPFWFSPDPRCVLIPAQLKVSGSMRVLFNKQAFRVTFDQDFEAVIRNCAEVPRAGQEETWISEHFIKAYRRLHTAGYAHSVEVWDDHEQLVGGLYGVQIGKVFFGESMFSKQSNASKYGFISVVRKLQKEGVELIDCQQETRHLKSLGAGTISRSTFLSALQRLV